MTPRDIIKANLSRSGAPRPGLRFGDGRRNDFAGGGPGAPTGYVPKRFQGTMQEWQKLHVLNYEMESATLLTIINTFGLQAAMVASAIVSRVKEETPDDHVLRLAEEQPATLIKHALELHINRNTRPA